MGVCASAPVEADVVRVELLPGCYAAAVFPRAAFDLLNPMVAGAAMAAQRQCGRGQPPAQVQPR